MNADTNDYPVLSLFDADVGCLVVVVLVATIYIVTQLYQRGLVHWAEYQLTTLPFWKLRLFLSFSRGRVVTPSNSERP